MTNFKFDEQKTTSLRHKITEDIRKAILQGKLKPGDRLREVEISKQMGVSRGPVREAMRMLEQEGLLYSHPYKETMVAEISGEEVLEVLIPIRLTIEQFALRKGLPHIQQGDIERLSGFVEEMKEGARQKNLARIVECDLAFHEHLVGIAKMNNLMTIWTSIYNQMRLHFIMQGQSYEDYNELWKDHKKLLQVVKEGDMEQIAQELKQHIYDTNVPFLKEHY